VEQHLSSNNVDTNTINHVSLCSGYGGIDLGLKRAIGSHLRTVAFVEIEAFAAANLAAKAEAGLLDNAPIWSDLKRFPWGKFHGLVDILSGGYPCQPFSAAGKRLGAEDPRHLWPHISAGIAAMRPSVCFFENVEGHISLGLPDVLQDLAGMGYRTTWCVASASECGAPHQRKRIFILAECQQQGLEGRASQQGYTRGLQREAGRSGHLVWPSCPCEQQFAWEPPRAVVGNAARLCASRSRSESSESTNQWWRRLGDADCKGAEQHDSETQPPLGRNPNGLTHRLDNAVLHVSTDNRTDELRLLGNGVVPATAERAFRVLVGELMEEQP
jgi:DNA (cytosine-5)-methyltransferase 1